MPVILGFNLLRDKKYELKVAKIADKMQIINLSDTSFVVRKINNAIKTIEAANNNRNPNILKKINQGVNKIASPSRWSFVAIPYEFLFTKLSGNFPGKE